MISSHGCTNAHQPVWDYSVVAALQRWWGRFLWNCLWQWWRHAFPICCRSILVSHPSIGATISKLTRKHVSHKSPLRLVTLNWRSYRRRQNATSNNHNATSPVCLYCVIIPEGLEGSETSERSWNNSTQSLDAGTAHPLSWCGTLRGPTSSASQI